MQCSHFSLIAFVAMSPFATSIAFADDKLPRANETRADDRRIGDGVDNIVDDAKERREGRHRVNTRDDVRPGASMFRESAFYVTPQFGGELMSMSEGMYRLTPSIGREFAGGYTYGGVAGYRAGLFSVGARFQRTNFPASGLNDMAANKVYAEGAINYRYGIMLTSFLLDVGYANIASRDATFHGVGGKVGAQLQFYVTRWFSAGPSAHFDVQGYDIGGGRWGSAVGGTFLASAGFHI